MSADVILALSYHAYHAFAHFLIILFFTAESLASSGNRLRPDGYDDQLGRHVPLAEDNIGRERFHFRNGFGTVLNEANISRPQRMENVFGRLTFLGVVAGDEKTQSRKIYFFCHHVLVFAELGRMAFRRHRTRWNGICATEHPFSQNLGDLGDLCLRHFPRPDGCRPLRQAPR